MSALRPILGVADVEATLAFYRDRLAFELQFALQDKNSRTFFASVSLGESSILLSRQQPLDLAQEIRHQVRADMSILLLLPDAMNIDDYYAQLRAKDVTIREGIADRFWGNREFTICDPNGYPITFSMPKHDVSLEAAKEISSRLDLSASDQDA